MIKFGPSGNSASFYAAGYEHTEEAAGYVKEMGLNCFEYSFGRGVRMTEAKARSIGQAFAAQDVEISVHAPYFINFANPDDEMAAKSYGYVLDSAKMVRLMGGKRVVFHPAAQGKDSRETAVSRAEDRLKILRDYIYLNELDGLMFCPETMGKLAQIGTPEEIVRFCRIDRVFTPCVDFGHVNAREQGSLKTAADYKRLLEYMIGELGYELYFHAGKAVEMWRRLLAFDEVKPAGLGARDTLRLEMGYPLYGHEMNEDTTPAEAGFGAMLKLVCTKNY